MRILIVDDHAIVRRGLKQILEGEAGLETVGEAQNAQEAPQMIRDKNWDLVILDINLPGRSGLEVLNELQHTYPKLPVLILSMYSEDQYALRVLKAGASGYLNKQSAPEELVKAIQKILAGGKYINEKTLELMASNLNTDSEKPIQEILSDREYQVLILIASGKTLSEIAESLSLSIKTVSTYRTRLLNKMKLKNNAELTYYAVHNDLLN
jgi:two-component system invasion response regulator UvrY